MPPKQPKIRKVSCEETRPQDGAGLFFNPTCFIATIYTIKAKAAGAINVMDEFSEQGKPFLFATSLAEIQTFTACGLRALSAQLILSTASKGGANDSGRAAVASQYRKAKARKRQEVVGGGKRQ